MKPPMIPTTMTTSSTMPAIAPPPRFSHFAPAHPVLQLKQCKTVQYISCYNAIQNTYKIRMMQNDASAIITQWSIQYNTSAATMQYNTHKIRMLQYEATDIIMQWSIQCTVAAKTIRPPKKNPLEQCNIYMYMNNYHHTWRIQLCL